MEARSYSLRAGFVKHAWYRDVAVTRRARALNACLDAGCGALGRTADRWPLLLTMLTG